jgi:hypothetical protein
VDKRKLAALNKAEGIEPSAPPFWDKYTIIGLFLAMGVMCLRFWQFRNRS